MFNSQVDVRPPALDDDPDETRRLSLLAELGVLDTEPERGFDAIVRLAASMCDCPMALISLIDGDRQWFKARVGIEVSESPRRWAFCARAIGEPGMMVVRDARLDPRFADNPYVTGAPFVRFYVGQPLAIDRVRIGTLCVVDTQPRVLEETARQALVALAETAVELLEARRHRQHSIEEQRRLSDFAMVSGDWLWETDVEHRVSWMSCAYATDSSMPEPWVVGESVGDDAVLDALGEPARPNQSLRQLFERKRAFAGAVVCARLPGEAPRYLLYSALCRVDRGGRWVGYRGIARDMTARVQAEQAGRNRMAAEKASQARGELISRVSHELRTPLNAILGFAQLLQINGARQPPEKTLAAVQQIEHAGKHLLSLVDDMLDLSRLDADRFELAIRPVAMVPLLNRVVALLGPHAQRHDVLMQLQTDPDTPAALADLRALKQVLFNLIGNAIKFAGSGSVVNASLWSEPASDRIGVAVTDNGPGIAAARLATLFEPFTRPDSAQNASGSSGLGLSICRKLVTAMKGQIQVSSEVGQGTTFTLYLPADGSPDEAADEESLQAASRDDELMTAAIGTATVLYIEDDPVNAVLMRQFFETLPIDSMSLVLAATGTEGLREAFRAPPDLILLDMNLPDFDGFAVLQRLKKEHRTAAIPVIAVSADALPEQICKARHAGFDDYWTKPLEFKQVRSDLLGRFAVDL